jgi:hypothetical protein
VILVTRSGQQALLHQLLPVFLAFQEYPSQWHQTNQVFLVFPEYHWILWHLPLLELRSSQWLQLHRLDYPGYPETQQPRWHQWIRLFLVSLLTH